MKKVFLTLCIASVTIGAFAQKEFNWEVQAGMNSAKVTNYGSRIGFHAGARAQIDLPSLYNGAYVNAGAFLSLKGTTIDWGDLLDFKINAYYLEIPVHLGYECAINDNFAVFGEFGPYFALGLFGKAKADELGGYHESHNTFDDCFKRFDFGLGLRLGVEFHQKYTFSIGYDFGLINAWKENDEEDVIDITAKSKNRNLTISLGYKF